MIIFNICRTGGGVFRQVFVKYRVSQRNGAAPQLRAATTMGSFPWRCYPSLSWCKNQPEGLVEAESFSYFTGKDVFCKLLLVRVFLVIC